eukprot:TRINITY_DN7997_c0_g1_i1.p1 TRINITY_DN7997_c0_g1~~TRINITY_DN7997_c0_g1_i1.p1  ORF type:complete len:131 (-),score=15.73 TRINITY_DN7997_c0_g1_i1:117-482(-)
MQQANTRGRQSRRSATAGEGVLPDWLPDTTASPSVKLVLSILVDLIGYITYLLPFVGEAFDVMWAPISGMIIYRLYGNAFLAFVGVAEEILPGTDFLPTALIAWFYENYFKRGAVPQAMRS